MGPDRKKQKRGTRIETRRWSQRPVAWVMPLAYAAAYAGLFSLSSVYWFLPAGLRLASLWMSPRRDWWRLALRPRARRRAHARIDDALPRLRHGRLARHRPRPDDHQRHRRRHARAPP